MDIYGYLRIFTVRSAREVAPIWQVAAEIGHFGNLHGLFVLFSCVLKRKKTGQKSHGDCQKGRFLPQLAKLCHFLAAFRVSARRKNVRPRRQNIIVQDVFPLVDVLYNYIRVAPRAD